MSDSRYSTDENANKIRQFNQNFYDEFRSSINELSKEEVVALFLNIDQNSTSDSDNFLFEKLIAIFDFFTQLDFFEKLKPIFREIKIIEPAPFDQRKIQVITASEFNVTVQEVDSLGMYANRSEFFIMPEQFPKDQKEISEFIFKMLVSVTKLSVLDATLPISKNQQVGRRVWRKSEYTQWQVDTFVSGYVSIFEIMESLNLDPVVMPRGRDELDRGFIWDLFRSLSPTAIGLSWYHPQENFSPGQIDYEAYRSDSDNFVLKLKKRYFKRFDLKWRTDWMKRVVKTFIIGSVVYGAMTLDLSGAIEKAKGSRIALLATIEQLKEKGLQVPTQDEREKANDYVVGYLKERIAEIEANQDLTDDERAAESERYRIQLQKLAGAK